jgi:hypothetical protein
VLPDTHFVFIKTGSAAATARSLHVHMEKGAASPYVVLVFEILF